MTIILTLFLYYVLPGIFFNFFDTPKLRTIIDIVTRDDRPHFI
jgi:hypothetical protein